MIKANKVEDGYSREVCSSREDTGYALLEELRELLGCTYLSDLRTWYWQSVLRLVLDRIPREKYGLKSWNQAAGYIMGKGISCTSCQEAREVLTEYSLQRLEDRMDWREDVRGGRHK